MAFYQTIIRRILTFLLLASVMVQSSASGQSKKYNFILNGSLHKTFLLESGGTFAINNVNGNIEITSWDKDEVEIDVEEKERRGGYDIEIEFSVSGNRISIETHHPRQKRQGSSSSTHFTIKVPKKVELTARSTNGSVSVREIVGSTDVRTTNGQVIIAQVNGDIDAHTTNGKIDIEDVEGDIKAVTTNKSIELRNVISSNITASSTNGSILADFKADDRGEYDFRTTNGNIRLYVPKDIKADITARCRGRNFRSDFDILTNLRDESGRRTGWLSNTIRGKLNGGGAEINMRTTNGRIDLKEK